MANIKLHPSKRPVKLDPSSFNQEYKVEFKFNYFDSSKDPTEEVAMLARRLAGTDDPFWHEPQEDYSPYRTAVKLEGLTEGPGIIDEASNILYSVGYLDVEITSITRHSEGVVDRTVYKL